LDRRERTVDHVRSQYASGKATAIQPSIHARVALES
jgi:hypothetical protein